MKRRAVNLALLCVVMSLTLVSAARAEIVTIPVTLTPGAEINPAVPPPATATGGALVTLNITRDSAGTITATTANFLATVNFPGSTTFTGFHIHEGAITANGPVRIDSGLTSGSPLIFAGGTGLINLTNSNINVAEVVKLLANPGGFYVNLHTTVNTAGAIRGQITRIEERMANTVALTTAAEVPPITDTTASGTATVTFRPVRDSKGVIISGTAEFTVTYDVPPNTTFTGLHIHEEVVGVNGPIRIDTGIRAAAPVITQSGKGTLTIVAPITATAAVDAFKRLVNNPVGFYVNMHTSIKTGGLIRGQMTGVPRPAQILQASTYFIPTGTANVNVDFLINDLALVVVNGTPVTTTPNLLTGVTTGVIPASALASAGTLVVQAETAAGTRTAPIQIVVAPQASVNTIPLTTVDAARYAAVITPNSIAAGFGTRLASTTVQASAQPLPTSLDGTSVYVNGFATGLFTVTPNQLNYLIPAATIVGPNQVVATTKDGSVSLGTLGMGQSAAAIFTARSDGTGAPAAVASTDGASFNIKMGNPDGTPIAINAGNFVALFGTGIRLGTAPLTISIGGTAVTPLFVGPAPGYEGLDQINLQIPQSLAGRGDVDLTITLDGKTSNAVKLKIN